MWSKVCHKERGYVVPFECWDRNNFVLQTFSTIPDSRGVSPGNLHHAQEVTTVTPYTAISGSFWTKIVTRNSIFYTSCWNGSVPMFPGTYVPRYRCSPNLCSPVPMFPGFCTLIVVISINRLQILPTPWYDSRLWLCLGFRFRVRLELQTVFRLWLGCGLGLSLYG